MIERNLVDVAATEALGAELATAVTEPALVFLYGNLGAGKTTLVRSWLRALGHQGPVKSPTYTLVEPYPLSPVPVYHFDLYRLSDPEELEYIGWRDYCDGSALILVEWPQQGAGLLPEPDLIVALSYDGEGRRCCLKADSALGNTILARLDNRNFP